MCWESAVPTQQKTLTFSETSKQNQHPATSMSMIEIALTGTMLPKKLSGMNSATLKKPAKATTRRKTKYLRRGNLKTKSTSITRSTAA